MDETKVIRIAIIVMALLMLLPSLLAIAPTEEIQQYIGEITSTDYARITDIEYKAVFFDGDEEQSSQDGYGEGNNKKTPQSKVVVTETITFDVRAASKNNLFWELWIGLGEETIDGLTRKYKVNSVKEVLEDGTKINWEESSRLYWDDGDFTGEHYGTGPNKWFHSEGPYSEANRRYECLLFYVDGIYRDQITFEIEYEMYNVVLKYADCAELYIPMYSGESIKHLKSFKGEILIPNKDMPKEWNYEATGFGTDKGSFEMEKSTTKHDGYTTFSFDLDSKDLKFLKDYEYLEFDMYAMGTDKHVFADFAEKNRYSSSNALDEVIENRNYYLEAPAQYKETVLGANLAVLFVGILILLLQILKLSNKKIPHSIFKKDKKNEYIFRDIPSDIDPKFAAELVFIKNLNQPKNNEDAVYASLLLSLTRKKYITVSESGRDTVIELLQPNDKTNTTVNPFFTPSQPNNNQYNVEQNMEVDREPLTYCERQYYSLLTRHIQGNRITIAELEKRIAKDNKFASDFQDKIQTSNINDAGTYAYTVHRIYDAQKRDMKKMGKDLIKFGIAVFLVGNLISILSPIGEPLFACGAIAVANILLGIYSILQSKNCVILTPYGEAEYQKWRGLYNFLKSDTLLKDKTHIELPLWEKYLVYATAFGISAKVIEAIRIKCVVLPPQTSIASTNHHRIRHIHSRSSSIRRSINASSHSHHMRHSGGGYNAGGRGIGGGGGGH